MTKGREKTTLKKVGSREMQFGREMDHGCCSGRGCSFGEG